MPDDWFPHLFEALESIYEQWDRLAASYLFLGYAAIFVLLAAAIGLLTMFFGR